MCTRDRHVARCSCARRVLLNLFLGRLLPGRQWASARKRESSCHSSAFRLAACGALALFAQETQVLMRPRGSVEEEAPSPQTPTAAGLGGSERRPLRASLNGIASEPSCCTHARARGCPVRALALPLDWPLLASPLLLQRSRRTRRSQGANVNALIPKVGHKLDLRHPPGLSATGVPGCEDRPSDGQGAEHAHAFLAAPLPPPTSLCTCPHPLEFHLVIGDPPRRRHCNLAFCTVTGVIALDTKGSTDTHVRSREGFPTFPHAREACSHNEQVDSGEARVFLVLKQQGVGCVEAGFFRARGVPSSRQPAVGRTERQPVCPFGRRVGMRCPDRHRCCQYFI